MPFPVQKGGKKMAAGVAAAAGALIQYKAAKESGNASAKGAADQFAYNLMLQRQQQQWNEYMYKHRYQFQRKDLEDAGINPLYGLGNATSPTSGLNSVSMPDYVGEKLGRNQNIIAGLALAKDWSAQKVANEKTKQETETEKSNTVLKQLEVVSQQINNLIRKKDLDYYDKRALSELKEQKSRIIKNLSDVEVNKSTIKLNRSTSALNNQKAITEGKIRENLEANSAKTRTEREKEKQTIEGIKRINEFYRAHPTLGAIATGGRELREAFGDLKDVGQMINDARRTANDTKRANVEKYKKRNNSAKQVRQGIKLIK